MACVRWRKDRGEWWVYFRPVKGGKQTARRIDKAPAKARLSKLEAATVKQLGEEIASENSAMKWSSIDLETALRRWLDNCAVVNTKQTCHRYRAAVVALLNLLCPDGERIALNRISTHDARDFRDRRLKAVAASTVKGDLKCLASAFGWLHRQRDERGQRLVDENPFEEVERPRVVHVQKYFPETAEVERLLVLLRATAPELFPYALLASLAGMRRSEIAHLRCDQVSLDRRMILVTGKSKHPREVPMHPRVFDFFMDQPLQGDYVFPSPVTADQHRDSNAVGRYFNAWLSENGFPFTIHALRRFFNEQLRASGLSEAVRLKVVGHESAEVNRLHYSKVAAQEAAPAVSAILRGSPAKRIRKQFASATSGRASPRRRRASSS